MTSHSRTKSRGNRTFVAAVLLILLAGLAVLAFVAARRGGGVAVSEVAPGAPAAALGAPAALDRSAYVIGSDSAPVEIVMYGDFECPGCGQFATITEPEVRTRLVATGRVRFRFADFPLYEIHQNALTAHNAAACASAQGKFWEMHDRIYHGQPQWARSRAAHSVFTGYARDLGLNADAFDACLEHRTYERDIIATRREGERLGVASTPTLIIGRRMIAEVLSYDGVKAWVDTAMADIKKSTTENPK